jgi:hypothetical protein
MANNIIFQDHEFSIPEIWFSYIPKAIYNVKGYYKFDKTAAGIMG